MTALAPVPVTPAKVSVSETHWGVRFQSPYGFNIDDHGTDEEAARRGALAKPQPRCTVTLVRHRVDHAEWPWEPASGAGLDGAA
jgi:hypothetical protein